MPAGRQTVRAPRFDRLRQNVGLGGRFQRFLLVRVDRAHQHPVAMHVETRIRVPGSIGGPSLTASTESPAI